MRHQLTPPFGASEAYARAGNRRLSARLVRRKVRGSMISRGFGLLAALAAFTLAGLGDVSAPAMAQPREGHFRVGVLVFGVFRGPLWSAFVEELRQLGYAEGQNTTLEVREAESQQERLPVLAAELVALNP